MASGTEKDDIEFRATISGDLLNATFEEGSPASNVEEALERVLDQHVASQDDSQHTYSYHHAPQVIRMILKAWRKYNVKIGEEFEPGYPLDGFDLGYAAADVIKDNINNPASLPYKVRSCMTVEMRVHLNQHEFTQETLQGIIDGASKAYLKIMAVAFAMVGDAGVPDLEPDPKPETATFTAVTVNSPDARGTKRKELSLSSDDDQKEDESARKSGKSRKKSTFVGGDDPEAMGDSPKPHRKSKKPMKSTSGVGGSFEIVDETPSLDPDGKAGRGSDGKVTRRQGNYDHGRSIKWMADEDNWTRDQLRANPWVTFTDLTTMHNQRWEGTTFDDGKNGTVERGKRTQEAIQRRFVGIRQELRGTKKDASATQDASAIAESSANFTAVNVGSSVTATIVRPQPDISWMGGINAAQEGEDEDEDEGEEIGEEETRAEEAEVRGPFLSLSQLISAWRKPSTLDMSLGERDTNYAQSLTDKDESDNDAAGDLEELERRMDAGESFEDE